MPARSPLDACVVMTSDDAAAADAAAAAAADDDAADDAADDDAADDDAADDDADADDDACAIFRFFISRGEAPPVRDEDEDNKRIETSRKPLIISGKIKP